MNATSGNLVIVGLGTPDVKYFWKGQLLVGVTKVFVYRGKSLTMTVEDKLAIPFTEMVEAGIKIKVAISTTGVTNG